MSKLMKRAHCKNRPAEKENEENEENKNENEGKRLNFLEIKIKNNKGRCEFDVYCKPALTNVQIRPHSCILSGMFWYYQRIERISCKS